MNFVNENKSDVLIAAHRGSCGGNIPPNTIAAFDAALYQGADILEIDIAKTVDDKFYAFHTGFEMLTLGISSPFEQLTSKQVAEIPILNEFGNQTHYRLNRFEDILEHLRGRCILNLDRCWDNWEMILPIIRRHGMTKQVLLKSPCRPDLLHKVQDIASDFAYIPIITEDIEPLWKMGGRSMKNLAGAELVFSSEDSPILQNDTISDLHHMNMMAWGNGIHFSETKVLSAGHNDIISVTGNPEEGWGWLIANGFDIIQTDWVCALFHFIHHTSC